MIKLNEKGRAMLTLPSDWPPLDSALQHPSKLSLVQTWLGLYRQLSQMGC